MVSEAIHFSPSIGVVRGMLSTGRTGTVTRSVALTAASDRRRPSRPELVRTASDTSEIRLEDA
jgi:hypothetical protein